MGSPPALLESLRSQRNFPFNFLLSPAKEQRNGNTGRKLKTRTLRALVRHAIFIPSHINEFLRMRRIDLYVYRPLNGKHKTAILCVLCGSAVINGFKFQ